MITLDLSPREANTLRQVLEAAKRNGGYSRAETADIEEMLADIDEAQEDQA